MVEALFLSHKCFPLVRRFQKWKILTSINCAVKYATIDAKKAGPVRPKTFVNVMLSMGDHCTALAFAEIRTNKVVKTLAKNPETTT